MSEHPSQLPEGALIASALKRSRLSARKAADRAGISEGRWRQIVKGYQTVSAGNHAPVRGPAETVARMAEVVGVTPEQLEEAGRADAAEELRALLPGPRTRISGVWLTGPVDEPTDEELRASGLAPETVQALLQMRRHVERLVAERDEDAIRRANRVLRALDEGQDAG